MAPKIKSRIVWTTEEKISLLVEIRNIYNSNNCPKSHIKVVEQAMHNVLTPERRRTANTVVISKEWQKETVLKGCKKVDYPSVLDTPIKIKHKSYQEFFDNFKKVTNRKGERVYWDANDRKLVKREIEHIIKNTVITDLSFPQIIELAQQALPEDKWRKASNVVTGSKEFRKKNFAYLFKHKEVIVEDPAPTPPKQRELEVLTDVKEKVETSTPNFVFSINGKALEKMVQDSITSAVSERVNKEMDSIGVREILEKGLEEATNKFKNDSASLADLILEVLSEKAVSSSKEKQSFLPPEQAKVGKHYKIGVCTLHSAQSKCLKRDLSAYNVDITVYVSDDASLHVAPNFDKVFVMTKFLSHSKIEDIKRNYSSNDLIYINGGLSSLKKHIVQELYPETLRSVSASV